KKVGKTKQPYHIQLKAETPFAFAGLWEHWRSADQDIESCTILTTTANELMQPLHDRMPVILPTDAYGQWLDPACQDRDVLLPLLRPYPAEEMLAYPVSTLVNKVQNEDPRCLEPEPDRLLF